MNFLTEFQLFRILLESAGDAQTHQRNRLGEYSLTGERDDDLQFD